MNIKEFYNEMVIVSYVGVREHESLWYLSDLSDDKHLFLIDAQGNRSLPFVESVKVRKATIREIAEFTLRDLGFRGSLDEIKNDDRRNELIHGLAVQTSDACKKQASQWERG